MKKRLISLVILLVVAGSAVAGAPLHSNEQSCSMGGAMGEMDCCQKAALAQSATPQVAAARLCCSLNCSQIGTTPTNGNPTSPQPLSISAHPANIQLPLPSVTVSSCAGRTHGPPAYSNPTYIRHLALLI